MKPPRLTRVHATALLLHARQHDGSGVLVVYQDRRIATMSAGAFMSGGQGRAMLWSEDLIESGARLASTGASLARGSGPIVDAILADANEHLRATWTAVGGEAAQR